jgi:hypothetical protein
MLQIIVPAKELYDEKTEMFFTTKEHVLQLEHSLVSLSKWESKWCKPFLTKEEKTDEESIDYIRCMTLTQNVDPEIYKLINQENIDAVSKYIEAPMTATTFTNENNKVTNREIVTSEIIYYWMVALNIPFECQKWHLNRLLTLINVCNIKNQPPKKMKPKDILTKNRALNEARLNELKTAG